MFFIELVICGLICCWFGGWIQRKRSIDYKKRWLEANNLLKQEQLSTGALGELEHPVSTGVSEFKLWYHEVVRGRKTTYFYITNGSKRVQVKTLPNGWGGYGGYLEDYAEDAKDLAASYNRLKRR